MTILTVLFLLSIILSVVSCVLIKKKVDEAGRILAIAGVIIPFISIFISLAVKRDFISASIAVMLADFLIVLPCFFEIIGKKIKSFSSLYKKMWSKLSRAAAILLVFEVFICNFGAFERVFQGGLQEESLSISQAFVDEQLFNQDTLTVQSNESKTLDFKDINTQIKTIWVDVSIENSTKNTIEISYSDDTNAAYLRSDAELNYINNDESSKYIVCSFFGNVGELAFKVTAPEDGSVTIKNISINKTIPFSFSILRYILLLIIVSFVIIILYNPKMKHKCGSSGFFEKASDGITILFLAVCACLFFIRGTAVFDLFANPDTNQINKELVDAFRAGQVSLLDEPSEELLALDNPYDRSMRSANDISVKWDHLLFNGKYYSYYGIGTVLTLFLPYNLITGNYFSSVWATFLYCVLGIIFLSLAYYEFVKRLFPKIPNGMAVSGLVILQSTSFIWYCMTIGNFYELAQASGFAFLVAGMYFLLRSGVVGKGKISRPCICIATILFSIAVLCRAALALYCLVSLLFIYAGVKKIANESNPSGYKANKKPIITFLLAAFIPYVLIGSIQMIYNYLRFGSILDFGITYTLTIYDYQHIQFSVPLMLIAIYNYLFTLPKVGSEFPFITANYDSLNVNGYYYLAGFSAAGLIFRALPTVGYAFTPTVYRQLGKEKKLPALIILCGCVIVPLIQMAMIWQYGYTPRYAVDFAWEILFGAFAILFVLNSQVSVPVKKILYNFFLISAVIAVVVNFSLTYEFVLNYGDKYGKISIEIRSKMLHFARLFEFWNIF
jgi:hypothetical protein